MSTAPAPQDIDVTRYTQGTDRYVNFAQEILDVHLTDEQKEIMRAVVDHERVIVMCGNGVGKSYTVALLKLAFGQTNIDSTVLGTSGSYSQYVDAVWRPMKSLHKDAKQRIGLPGETYDGGQPTLEIDDDWFMKVVSPRDPGDLEGRHAESMLIVIEEADKEYITGRHFDSAGSSITDTNDRMIAICNPPEDESDVVYEKLQSNRWHVIQFSSFDSHNVRVDTGEIDEPKIPGLIDLDTIKDDWEAWNNEPWPGIEEARTAHERRDDLDVRWYRRRAGVIPPATAEAHRPIYTSDVEAAMLDHKPALPPAREGIGVDIGRTTDRTAIVEVRGNHLHVREVQQGLDHPQNESLIRGMIEDGELDGSCTIDALGEGSGVAAQLSTEYDEVERFFASAAPEADDSEYKDKRSEALGLLGEFLRNGGTFHDQRLREELFAAARSISFERRSRSGRDVLKATPKQEIKARLGRSPDVLDAAAYAVWAAEGAGSPGPTLDDLGWGT